jgi:hypothetical protein
MTGRKIQDPWWTEIARVEHFNRAEWMLLGVSALTFVGAVSVLLRFVF